MDSSQAFQNFWSSFGWEAYDSATVPSEDLNPAMPRITYDVAVADFDSPVTVSASLWDRGYSWQNISEKAMDVYDRISLGGVLVPFDGGVIWIKRGQPFLQRMSDEDDTIRRIYLNIEVEFLTST